MYKFLAVLLLAVSANALVYLRTTTYTKEGCNDAKYILVDQVLAYDETMDQCTATELPCTGAAGIYTVMKCYSTEPDISGVFCGTIYGSADCKGTVVGKTCSGLPVGYCDPMSECCAVTGSTTTFTTTTCDDNDVATTYVCTTDTCKPLSGCTKTTAPTCYNWAVGTESVSTSWDYCGGASPSGEVSEASEGTDVVYYHQSVYTNSKCDNDYLVTDSYVALALTLAECKVAELNCYGAGGYYTTSECTDDEPDVDGDYCGTVYNSLKCTGKEVGKYCTSTAADQCNPFDECCSYLTAYAKADCSDKYGTFYLCTDKDCTDKGCVGTPNEPCQVIPDANYEFSTYIDPCPAGTTFVSLVLLAVAALFAL